jgi:glycosyltransferase involved in cell wall biosynthesis
MSGEKKIKILIMSYFFPPCNITASQRALSWAKYLGEFGFYPIVITRNWERPVHYPSDLHHDTHQTVIHQKFGTYEVYYLPYKQSLRDKLFTRSNKVKFPLIRQLLTFWELMMQNFVDFVIPFRNFYSFTKKFLEKNKDINLMVVTANPYVLFKFASRLKKDFDRIQWIADYRDDWNTRLESHWYNNYPFMSKYMARIERNSELKWTANAALISSVSELNTNKISQFLNKKGITIYNGFIPEDFEQFAKVKPFDEFTITFNGTMIEMQEVGIFIAALKRVITEYQGRANIKINFIGTGYDVYQEMKIKTLMEGFEKNLNITHRVPRKKVIEIQMRSHVLLLVAYGHVKGVAGTKTFDYLATGKPIILCPSDNDLLARIITETGQGIICNNEDESYTSLKGLVESWLKGEHVALNLNAKEISFYTRKKQAEILAEQLKELS